MERRQSVSSLPPYSDTASVVLPPYEQTESHTTGNPTTTATTSTLPTRPSPTSQPSSSTPQSSSSRPTRPKPAEPSATNKPSLLTDTPWELFAAWRRDRARDRKVRFYEEIYGFVPKNVMSEAEWRAARRAAPKERKKGEVKATPMFGPR